MKKIALFLIDPQNDFCVKEDGENKGSLVIPGAHDDMKRCASFIRNNLNYLNQIFITKDWHNEVSIDNVNWFVSKNEIKTPTPLKMYVYSNNFYVGRKDQGINTFTEEVHLRTVEYYKYAINKGVFPTVWPKHGIQGTWGAEVVKEINDIIREKKLCPSMVKYFFKGTCPLTEQFSIFKSVMEVEGYPETKLNMPLIRELNNFDHILVAGEAFNFCVKDSIIDLVENSPYPFNMSEKIVIIRNFTSEVPGFEKETEKFESFLNSMNIRQINIENDELPDEYK